MKRKKDKKEETEDVRYENIARSVLSSVKGGEEQKEVLRILSTEKAREVYQILYDEDIPENAIKEIMTHSLRNFQRGKGLTPASYAMGIAKSLARSEEYGYVVDDMYEEGVISERQYEGVKREIKDHAKRHIGKLSGLERIAASVFGVAGVGVLIASGLKITGNVIGNSAANTFGAVAGIVLIILSLVLSSRSFKN